MSAKPVDKLQETPIFLGVVIPVYNRAPLVCRALNSLISQTRLPDCIVVVDNNSTDNLHDVLRAWQENTLVQQENFCTANQGSIGTANQGTTGVSKGKEFAGNVRVEIIREASAGAANARQTGFEYFMAVADNLGINPNERVIAFLDSDDIWSDGYAEFISKTFGADTSLDLLVTRLALDKGGAVTHPHFDARNPMRCHLIHGMVNTGAMVARAPFFERIGGWNRELRIWDDWELGVRMLLAQPNVRYVADSYYKASFTPESLTGMEYSSRAGRYEVAIDAIESQFDSREDIAPGIRRLIPYRRAILAAHYAREGHRDLALKLLDRALADPRLSALYRMELRLLYHYTVAGGRGASLLWH